MSPLALPPPLSLGTSSVCYVYVVCVFYFSLFFGVNFSVEFCMLHSRTETFLIPSFHFLLRSLIWFCFAFADCFVFEKWLSHHFYCIFECLSLSISMYLSPCVCARVCWVFVTKIYALQFTHTHKNTERGREEESHKKQSKAFVSRLHRVESEKASTCGGWHCGNGNAKVLNSQLTKREFRFSMHCIV